MPRISIEVDETTLAAARKNTEIWGRDFLSAEMGTASAIRSDVWNGWGGLLTTTVMYHPGWKWPLWIREQTDPNSPGYIPVGFSWGAGCTFNKRYRSWTMIGLRDADEEGVVGLDGAMMPRRDSYGVTVWLHDGSRLLAVGERGRLDQRLEEGYLPIVNTRWTTDAFALDSQAFASSIDGVGVCFQRTTITNATGAAWPATLFVVVNPWGPDAFHPVRGLAYDGGLDCFLVEGKAGPILPRGRTGVGCRNYDGGDVCVDAMDGELDGTSRSECTVGWCSAAVAYSCRLGVGESRSVTVHTPIPALSLSPEQVERIRAAHYEEHLELTKEAWRALVDRGMQIRVPDARVVETCKSVVVNLHLLKDGGVITPGPLTYHIFWIRDAAHMIKGLDMAGYPAAARECLEELLTRGNQDGYFENTHTNRERSVSSMVEYDSNGQAVWAVVQHYRMNRDRAWLERKYPLLKSAVDFLVRLRREAMRNVAEDQLHYGLFPKSWSAEHTGPFDHIYYDDFWGLCGLKEAAFAADELGLVDDARWLREEYEAFARDVWRSIERSVTSRGLACFAASPYQDVSATIVGNIAAVWPCGIAEPEHPRIGEVLETLYRDWMPNGCWFNRHIWGAYGPILTWPIANCFVHLRDVEKVSRILSWTLAHGQTTTHAWPEGINARTLHGGEGDGYEAWGAAEFLMLLRNMLFLERGDTGWILPAVLPEWLRDGSVIEVTGMTTPWGSLDLRVESALVAGILKVSLKLPEPGPRGGYRLFARHPEGRPILSVATDGKSVKPAAADEIAVPPGTARMEIRY